MDRAGACTERPCHVLGSFAHRVFVLRCEDCSWPVSVQGLCTLKAALLNAVFCCRADTEAGSGLGREGAVGTDKVAFLRHRCRSLVMSEW